MEQGTFTNQTQGEVPVLEQKYQRRSVAFSSKEALAVVRSGENRAFRIHVIVGVGLSLLGLALWIFIAFGKAVWPFFFYIANFFILTTSVHYYLFIRPREFFPLHVVWYSSINLMLLLTWFFTINWVHAWFLYPLLGWGMFLAIHYLVHTYPGHPDLPIYIHLVVYGFVSALCFFIWLACSCMPFFIFVVFILGIPFSIHWCLHFNPGDKHKLHLLLFLNVQLLLFFIYIEHTPKTFFPWFVFPLLVWGVILAIHFWKFPRVTTQSPPLAAQDEHIIIETSNPAFSQPQENYTNQPPPPYTPGSVPLETDSSQNQTLYSAVQK
jgi:hypothetical protein